MPPKVAQMIKEQEEQKIFKKFEELGYVYIKSSLSPLTIFSNNNKDKYILINTDKKVYRTMEVSSNHACLLTMKEHQLLHRLFEIWGWFDE